jgi:hypothetical protein
LRQWQYLQGETVMLDHAEIRGDHLTDLDLIAVAMQACNYTDQAAAYELSGLLSKQGYGTAEECLAAARAIVIEAKKPREAGHEIA